MATPKHVISVAETMDAPLDLAESGPREKRAVALVAGSAPHLSSETQSLLRSRIRAAGLVLFAGFLAFTIKSLFYLETFQTPLERVLFWSQLAVTVVTGLIGMRLCRHCAMSIVVLRGAELLVFGAPALFFVQLNIVEFLQSAELGFMPMVAAPWILLIFTYAMFIPNTWRRAAIVIGCMAAAPAIVGLTLWQISPAVRQVLAQPQFAGFLLSLAMIMAVTAVSATFGVHTIGTLRRVAFEARQLGQYRLKHKLGAGGMGEVYLAEHQLMKRPCAIKVIKPDKAGDPQVLARFEREVRATAKLTHWNSVEIFDYGRSDEGTFYYVMEYLPGMNLGDLVEGHGPLNSSRAIHLLMQTCDALAEAHAHGLIHRDIKPGNIFAAQRGGIYDVAKLLDFGLAKPLAGTGSESVELTQEGSITGSPLFMAPEQAMGEERPDARSDIYSLGVVAYYLLTGQPPFNYDKAMKVLIAHAKEPVVPPTRLRADVPEDLELVVLRCMAKDPDDRYQSAEDLRAALADCNAAGRWSREDAEHWWHNFGCPRKRALDRAIMGREIEAAV